MGFKSISLLHNWVKFPKDSRSYFDPTAGGLVLGPRWASPNSFSAFNMIGHSSMRDRRATLGNVRFVKNVPKDKYSWSSDTSGVEDIEWLPMYNFFGHADYYDNFSENADITKNPLRNLWNDLGGLMYIVVGTFIVPDLDREDRISVWYTQDGRHHELDVAALSVFKRIYFDRYEDAVAVRAIVGDSANYMGNVWATLCHGYDRDRL